MAQRHDRLRDEGKEQLVSMMDDLFTSLGHRIEELLLRNSRSVIDMTIFNLCDHENASSLLSLDLSYCSNVTDKSLKRLSSYRCSDGNGLRSLWLTGCSGISETGIRELLSKETAKSLSSIDISKCNQVKCISCFEGGNKHNIRTLRAASCGKLREIALTLPSSNTIREISVPDCEALSSVRFAFLSLLICTTREIGNHSFDSTLLM